MKLSLCSTAVVLCQFLTYHQYPIWPINRHGAIALTGRAHCQRQVAFFHNYQKRIKKNEPLRIPAIHEAQIKQLSLTFLPPASAVKVIFLVPSVCLSVFYFAFHIYGKVVQKSSQIFYMSCINKFGLMYCRYPYIGNRECIKMAKTACAATEK